MWLDYGAKKMIKKYKPFTGFAMPPAPLIPPLLVIGAGYAVIHRKEIAKAYKDIWGDMRRYANRGRK